MTDTLERAVDRLHALPSPVDWADVEARAASDRPVVAPATSLDDRRHRTRARLLVVGAAAALILAVVVAWPRAGDEAEVVTDPVGSTSSVAAPTTEGVAPTTQGATITDPSALAAIGSRRGAVTALTDDAFLVWGGESEPTPDEIDRTDGFAVDLDSGAVTEIPPAPLDPDVSAMGAWTGTELVVWSTNFGCVTCSPPPPASSAAAWDPTSRTWRSIAAPPLAGEGGGSAAVWTGEQIVTVTSVGTAATYTPEDDRWDLVPAVDAATPGRHPGDPSLLWTGEEVVFWSTAYFAGPYPGPVGSVVVDRGWRWTPGTDSWSALPDQPDGVRTTRATAVWDGSELVVWGTAGGGGYVDDIGVGARWRPDDGSWRPMAPSPQGADRGWNGTMGSQAVVADGAGRVVVRPLSLAQGVDAPRPLLVYDPTSDTWTSTGVEPGSGEFAVRNGTVFVPDPMAPVAGQL